MDKQLIFTDQSNILDKAFCEHVINRFNEDDRKHDGVLGKAKVDKTHKISTDLHVSRFKDWITEDQKFNIALWEALNNYRFYLEDINEFLFPFHDSITGVKDSGYQIQHTPPGGYYHWHSDEYTFSTHEPIMKHTKTFTRELTYIFYLNDVHEDGYTEFIDGTKVQPQQGKYLIFPATWSYVHRGFPPKSEDKYIATGWIHSTKLFDDNAEIPYFVQRRGAFSRVPKW